MKIDHSYINFLDRQADAAEVFNAQHDRMRLFREPGRERPDSWVVELDCKTLVRSPGGPVETVDGCAVAIRFPSDYLSRAETFEILRWAGPELPFHPNVHPVLPVICVGKVYPAMTLVELCHQVHAVASWRNVTLVESDALNSDACAWARSNPDRWPTDDRAFAAMRSRFEAEVRRIPPADGCR